MRNSAFFFADYEGFRQTRGLAASSTIPTLAQRQGILSVAVRNPLTGEIYPAGTPIPMTAFARKVLGELPDPTNGGTVEQLRRAPAVREHHRQVRRQGRRERQSAADGVRPLRVSRRRHLRSAADSAAVRRRRQRPDLCHEQAARGGHDLHAVGDIAARGALRLVEDAGGEEPGGARFDVGARRLRHHRAADGSPRRGRAADAAHHGLQRPGAPGDQSAVAVPDGLQPEGELHVARRPPFAQERLRVPAHSDRSAGRQPALRPRQL